MTACKAMMQEANNFGGNAGSRLHQVTPAFGTYNAEGTFLSVGGAGKLTAPSLPTYLQQALLSPPARSFHKTAGFPSGRGHYPFSVKKSRLARWAERLGLDAEYNSIPRSGVSPARRTFPHWSGSIGQQHNNCTTPAAVANCGRFSIFAAESGTLDGILWQADRHATLENLHRLRFL